MKQVVGIKNGKTKSTIDEISRLLNDSEQKNKDLHNTIIGAVVWIFLNSHYSDSALLCDSNLIELLDILCIDLSLDDFTDILHIMYRISENEKI